MNRTAPTAPYTSIAHDVPTVAALDLVTCNTLQIVVQCPRCDSHHRHLGLGLRRSPCGTWYIVAGPSGSTAKLVAA